MIGRRRVLALALLLAGCGQSDALRPYAVVRRADVWQAVISDADRGRLARLSDAWTLALADVDGAGAGADLAALGPLAVPPAAVADGAAPAGPLPGPGDYRCRLVRLGWRQGAPRPAQPVTVEPWARCRLASDGILLRFETAAARQTLFGTLYPDVDRLVFLGSVALAGEPGRLRYGDDADRDQLGALDAIGPGHWRLALPWPRWTARLVLLEVRAD